MARKLDLSKLTEDEAQHVLHVVQRDLDLRKQEEDRLGELRSKIEEETTKRKFLTKQAKFNEGHCIHCLEPFQFLVNSKRRCLDCCLYTCKSCSKFNKKEYGWVCDSCRIARIVNTGSLDWFYNHVKSRFKNFGSAKVMHSLHKRLQPGEKHRILRHLDAHYEQDGFDNVSDNYLHGEYNPQKITGVIEEDEPFLDHTEAHRLSTLRRNKRLLSVHPIDFDMDSEYSAQSRRQSFQLSSPHYDGSGLQSFSEFSFAGNGIAEGNSRRGSLIGEAELTSVFRNILHEKGQNLLPESEFSTEVRLEINKRRKSLDKSSKSDEVLHHEHRLPRTRSVPGIWTSPGESELHHSLPYQKHGVSYYADMESSDNDEAPEHPVYQRHFVRHRNKSSSQENSASGGSQLSDLSKRMSSIERMLCKLEEKMTPNSEESPANAGRLPVSPPVDSEASGLDLTDADIEEEKLKKKLGELASNISDKGASSDEEEVKRKTERTREITSSSEDLHSEALKVYMAASTNYGLERQLKDLEERARSRQSHTTTTTDSELSELEDKVASAVAKVQYTESEAMMVHQYPRRKCLNSTGNKESKTTKNDAFHQNLQNRGSLTQRNASNKRGRLDRVFGKPIMSMRP
ncbi:melanophilin-like isoform X5 [Mustelus asterias]